MWEKIPVVYQEQATFYTDQYEVYKGVIPSAQHRAISKLARKTNHVERFNCTLRQRVSRLVRATLSFSKKLSHHIGAIRYLFVTTTSPEVQHYQDSTTGVVRAAVWEQRKWRPWSGSMYVSYSLIVSYYEPGMKRARAIPRLSLRAI